MSVDHPPGHEELLRAVRAGERDPEEPAFQEQLRSCPHCAATWRRLEDVAARLSAAARAQRVGIESAAARPSGPGEERIEATLARLVRAEPHRTPRRWGGWAWLAAAGVLAAGTFAWRAVVRERVAEEAPDVPLGVNGLRVLEPVGAVRAAEFARFAWEYHEDATEFGTPTEFLLLVYAEGDRLDPLINERPRESEWIPSPEQRRALPERIDVVVQVLDAFGEPLPGSASASAWLSP